MQSGEDDLIFFTGDLTSRGMTHHDRAINLLCEPKGRIGNVACMGDHDFWTAPEQSQADLERCGWDFLRDRHKVYQHKGKRILVTGLTYVYSKRISPSALRELCENAPEADLKIMFVHQPRAFLAEIAAEYGYQLFMGGHTHGGEVVIHVFGIPLSPSKLETPYCWGLHKYKDTNIVVSNGIGRTLASLRYHAPAEIKKIVLVRK